jgi:hypothetical protein
MEHLKLFEDFVDKVTYEMTGSPKIYGWPLKADFEAAVGKIITVPNPDGDQTGQLVGLITGPSTVQATLKFADGTTKNVPIVSYNKTYSSPMDSASYYGSKV